MVSLLHRATIKRALGRPTTHSAYLQHTTSLSVTTRCAQPNPNPALTITFQTSINSSLVHSPTYSTNFELSRSRTNRQTALKTVGLAAATNDGGYHLVHVLFSADNFGRPFVKRFALCYRTVVCPVCNVGVLRSNGWVD